MGFVIAIENEDKFIKELKENISEVARTLGHELLMYATYEDFLKEKNNNQINQAIILMILNHDTLGAKPVEMIEQVKKENSCEVVTCLFSDPSKSHKKTGSWPVQNIIYKPFDLTILKEHIHFALMPKQKVKTLFVHTTQAASEVESLRKFKILELSEFGMKLDKFNKLSPFKPYKFYHPAFTHSPYQHVWGRVVAETDDHYEVLFCQVSHELLTTVRKKVNSCNTKNKKSIWLGRKDNTASKPKLLIFLDHEETALSIQELLSRHYPDLTLLTKKDLKPNEKIQVDLLITDHHLDKKNLEALFTAAPLVIRIIDTIADRKTTESEFEFEAVRILKPFDKSFLVRAIESLFPKLIDIDAGPKITGVVDEFCDQTFLMPVTEFSEAAIVFKQKTQLAPGMLLEIATPQKDESRLTEMKAKVQYVDPTADAEGLHSHQLVLFGMKDEFLKLIRLWALDVHIKTHQKD